MPCSTPPKRQRDGYLDGSLLLAMPAMGDPRFARAVIYMCAHSPDGAMGIIINHISREFASLDVGRLSSLKE